MNINRIFDKVFCLSLESRHDRWLAVNQEFINHNIKVERFFGMQGNLLEMPLTANVKSGAVACTMGHLFLHKLAEMHSQTMVDEAQLNALRKELVGLRMSEFEEELRESPQELLKG